MKLTPDKKFYLAATLAIVSFSQPSPAIIINDNYEGGSSLKSDGTSYGDVIGNTSNFQINYMDVSFDETTNILSVGIDTTFGGKGDNGLFSSYTNTTQGGSKGIGYGDLFLSSAWTPYNGISDAPYVEDNHSNGTVWSYGFSLDDRWGVENTEHNGTLYSLNSGNNDADAYLSDDFLSSSTYTYRNGQEVAVDTDSGNITAVSGGTWMTMADKVNFEIDLTDTDLLNGSVIAFHWGMTCGNDTIEGQINTPTTRKTPEPAVLWLLALGLVGIGLSKRNKANPE